MPSIRTNFLISSQELYAQLNRVKIIDASWFLPNAGRDARAEYETAHIPNAVFFDLDMVCEQNNNLPHMLPAPEVFADAIGRMGIHEKDPIVIYDSAGLFSAPRVWWSFKVMGAQNIRILDGGLPAWQAAGYAVTNEISPPSLARFTPTFHTDAVATLCDMKAATASQKAIILDARPAARFSGTAPEPRADLPSGHMPHSLCLPASDLIEKGYLKPDAALKTLFDGLTLNPTKPIITTCGSGVTAAIITFALSVIGRAPFALYDGAWTEWASAPDTDILTGT